MLNKVILIGRLTKDPEVRITTSGISVCAFNIAVDKNYVDKNSGQRDADFIRCVIWRKSAENFANFVSKGSLVGIEGELTTRSYEDQNGQKNYMTEVSVDKFYLLESKEVANGRKANQQGGYNNQQSNYNNQQGGYNNQPANYNNQPTNYNNNQRGGYNNQPTSYNNNQQNGYNGQPTSYNNQPASYNQNQKPEDPFSDKSYGDTIDISDDDLPF